MSNSGGVYTWSKTAANNASADSTVNYAEGQAPSSINDSARGAMASVAKWRDDISGAIVTTGTSAAYIVASNQVFDSLADMNGQVIAFTPHATNAAGPITMTVDSFANLPLRSSPGVELLAGTLIAGTPYIATKNSDGVLYLHSFYGNPYNVPLGGGLLHFGSTVPSSAFAFANGAAISRTTYAALFTLLGSGALYGVGDGSTTFNLPNLSGRVPAGREAAASLLTTSYFGADSTVLGSPGGAESKTLAVTNLPPYTPTGAVTGSSSGGDTILVNGTAAQNLQGGTTGFGWSNSPTVKAIAAALSWAGSFVGVAQGGVNTPIRVVQPTLICNFIIRII